MTCSEHDFFKFNECVVVCRKCGEAMTVVTDPVQYLPRTVPYTVPYVPPVPYTADPKPWWQQPTITGGTGTVTYQ